MSRLPKAVREAGIRADQGLESLKNPQQESVPKAASGEAAPDTAPPVVEEETFEQAAERAIPEKNEDDKKEEGFELDWKAESEAMKEERDKAVKQFQTLSGKYNAEVPRLSAEIRELKEKLQNVQAAPAPEVLSGELSAKISKLKEVYGDDIEDVINYAVSQATGKAVETARKEFEPRLSRVDEIENRSYQTQQDAVFSAIGKAHSDWEKINGMATFHRYLAEKVPGTTRTRQQAIDEALSMNDPEPIIHQLTQFKRRVNRGNSSMESQVVPGDAGRSDPGPQADRSIYPMKEIQGFDRMMANNASRNIPLTDEQNRMRANYDAALREGRVS